MYLTHKIREINIQEKKLKFIIQGKIMRISNLFKPCNV